MVSVKAPPLFLVNISCPKLLVGSAESAVTVVTFERVEWGVDGKFSPSVVSIERGRELVPRPESNNEKCSHHMTRQCTAHTHCQWPI